MHSLVDKLRGLLLSADGQRRFRLDVARIEGPQSRLIRGRGRPHRRVIVHAQADAEQATHRNEVAQRTGEGLPQRIVVQRKVNDGTQGRVCVAWN